MEAKDLKQRKFNLKIDFFYIAIILIAIFCICITPITFQNDTFYSIKIGEYIKTNGIDMMDHFSWHNNLPYTYPHWLYDLITYVLYSISGFKGLYITTCILSSVLGISIFIVNNKLTKSKVISFIVTIGAIYFLRGSITARAQLITFILFIWEIFYIEKFIENRKIYYGIILILISMLIANLHAATWPFFFILFLPYIAEYVIALINGSIKNKNVKFLLIIIIVCMFTGLLTPIKDTPYTYLYKTMIGNTTQNIVEHGPLILYEQKDVMTLLIMILTILIFTKTKIKLSDLFMISGLGLLMFATQRQVSMFVLICSISISRLLIDFVPRITGKNLEEEEKQFNNIGVICAITVLMFLFSGVFIYKKIDDKYVDENQYPVKACDFILENIDLKEARFYNEYDYGSYMIYRDIPVFIDSRADLYAPEFNGKEDIFSDYRDIFNIYTYYEKVLDKYKITHLILKKDSVLNMLIIESNDKNFEEIYEDENFVIKRRIM